MTAGTLAHRLGIHRMIVLLNGVAHRTLSVVHRAGGHSDERNRDIVGHLIDRRLAPLHLFQTENSFIIDDVRVRTVESDRLERTVEINQKSVFSRGLGGTPEEINHILVVTIHKIYLEALDSHLGVILADVLHIPVESIVAGPKDEAYVVRFGIFTKHREIDLRDDLHQIGFLVDSPAFIEDDIFDAMLLGEVDVVLVGVVVDAGAEVHSVEVPSVPPVPSDFSRLHPAEILRWIGRLAKLPDHIINSQIGITR